MDEIERPHNIIVGQRVDDAKLELAKKLRREMTPAERILWSRLRANRFAGLHFRRQQVISGYVADFYCHAVGLAVEVDGPIHEQQADYDAGRDEAFAQLRIRTLRVSNDAVFSRLEEVLDLIRGACGVQNPSPSPPRSGEGRPQAENGTQLLH